MKKPRIPTLRQSAATKRNWSMLRLKCAVATLRYFMPGGKWSETIRQLERTAAEEIERQWQAELQRIADNERKA